MRTKDIIEGMTILQKYYDDALGAGYNTGAEHDQIWMYETHKPISEEDLKRLEELGWHDNDGGWACWT